MGCSKVRRVLAEAIDSYQRALALDPNNLTARSNLLAGANYAQFMEPGETLVEHRAWSEAYRRTTAFEPYEKYRNKREPNRPLRLGYLSPDFRTHSVAFFLQPILRGTTATRLNSRPSRMSPGVMRLRSGCGRCSRAGTTSVPSMTAAAASCIYEEAVDVLIDLAGHTEGGRPGVLARAPAPVADDVSGLSQYHRLAPVKYRITDAIVDPPGRTEPFIPRPWCGCRAAFYLTRPPKLAHGLARIFLGPLPLRRSTNF